MSSIVAALSKAKEGPFYGLLASMYNQIKQRDNANETYVRLKLIIDDLLMRGYSFETPEMQATVEMLKELPAFGANSRNFEKLYLKDEYGLRKLPSDPRRIPKGHWH